MTLGLTPGPGHQSTRTPRITRYPDTRERNLTSQNNGQNNREKPAPKPNRRHVLTPCVGVRPDGDSQTQRINPAGNRRLRDPDQKIPDQKIPDQKIPENKDSG